MKKMVYVPEVCRGDQPKFVGNVVLMSPSVFEKLELNDKYEQLKETKATSSRLTIEMLKSTQEYYLEVNLKNLESGEEYKSFDDMTTEPLLEMTLVEIAARVFRGSKPGEV